MQFTSATLNVFNPESYTFSDQVRTLHTDSGGDQDTRITFHERNTPRTGPIAMLRVHSSTARDEDDDPLLLDMYEIWSPALAVYGDTLVVDGFMQGTDGSRRDGTSVPGTDQAPFVKVQWVLR